MLNDLPQRAPVPFLPVPGTLLLDDRKWSFRAERGGPAGLARIRVWRGLTGGSLAVVTAGGDGPSVTTAAAEIYQRVSAGFSRPVALMELWPAGEGMDQELHLDLVEVPPGSSRARWQRVYPSQPGHALHDLMSMWWAVSADDILAP